MVPVDDAAEAIRVRARAGQKERALTETEALVALARERVSARAGRVDDLNALYEAWKRSDDPCLRMAGSQREQLPAAMAVGPPSSPPP